VPDEPEKKQAKPGQKRISRAGRLGDDKTPHYPEIPEAAAYLVGALMEAGPTTVAGMGEIPLTWADLAAYQRGSGQDFAPWELRLIRRLSSEYLSESIRAKAPDARAPWIKEVTAEQRSEVAQQMRDALRGMR
jgi:hypothetical protein